MGDVTKCGICGAHEFLPVLDMGHQPLAEDMREDAPRYPLRLVKCADCDLHQLDYIVDQREVFKPDHTYSTGNSRALREHFAKLAAHIIAHRGRRPTVVVDIGANDGTLLDYLPSDYLRIAVEPTNQAKKASEKGMVTYQNFFSAALAERIRKQCGPADVITATNVLAHVPEPHDFIEGVRTLLADNGVFITENHDVASVYAGQIDTVYHEHLRYYSPETLRKLIERHGMGMDRDTQNIPTHGGSFRAWCRHANDLQRKAENSRDGLATLLRGIPPHQRIWGIGAATRATPLLHFSGLDKYIEKVCEVSTSDKIGHVMPGTHIPIVDEAELISEQPDYAVLFAWHMADVIVPNLRKRGYRGRIIVPLPWPKVMM